MKNPHLPLIGQAGENKTETSAQFTGLSWPPVRAHVAMLRGSQRPEALVLLTLFPPKARPGEQRGGSTFYLATVGKVLADYPHLLEAITSDLQRRPGWSLGLIVNEPLSIPPDWPANPGNGANWGASNAHIGLCRWLFAECDHEGFRPADQLALAAAVFGTEPTLSVHTGGKSVHCYYRLQKPIASERFTELQKLVIAAYEHLAPGCKVDQSLGKPAQVMRLAGGVHPGTGVMASIHTASTTIVCPDALETRLRGLLPSPEPRRAPAPPPHQREPQRPTGKNRGRSYQPTLRDIADALATYPRRVPGQRDYPEHRNLLWGLVKACEEAGYGIETAISLMEAHSPSAVCGWEVRQVATSGGRDAHPGWFWALAGGHPTKPQRRERQGVRP